MMLAVAALLIAAVLIGPILLEPVERNLEIFFFAIGLIAALSMGQLDWALVRTAMTEPIALSAAVLIFGGAFRLLRPYLDRMVARTTEAIGERWLCFGLTILLGVLSSIITAVIAALILVETLALLKLNHPDETFASVLACFAIGLGASLTPLGEPLSTIAIAALSADFWYLARLVGPFVIVGILAIATFTYFVQPAHGEQHALAERESWTTVVFRAVRIYLFIAGLVALSHGLRPVVDAFLPRIPDTILFWLNSLSALVDNATLAAIEIGPRLSLGQQRSALLSLLISGGMLIPGNVPNIVAASRLRITSREWTRIGLPIGLALLVVCFAILNLID